MAGPVMITIEGATAKIQGFVRDASTNLSISNAWVSATNTDNGTIAGATPFGSHYVLLLNAGTYNLTCMAQGYQSESIENLVIEDQMVRSYSFLLEPVGSEIYTGIAKSEVSAVKIFPNPASDYVMVQGRDIKKVLISNHNGRVIFESRPSADHPKIDLSEIPAGLYFIKIQTNTETIIQKLLVR